MVMPGVANTYLRYESAGDQYVGRCVSDLLIIQKEFEILPPRFRYILEEGKNSVTNAFRSCFPKCPVNMIPILEHRLASVIYHNKHLLSVLPSDHILFNTPLFRGSTPIEALQDFVVCQFTSTGGGIQATGIPPHCTLLSQVSNIAVTIANMKPAIVSGVMDGLEEREITANSVTPHS
jgi:hypothetical protein